MKSTAKAFTLLLVLLVTACNKAPSDAHALLEANPPPANLPPTNTAVLRSARGFIKINLSQNPDCMSAARGSLVWKAPDGVQNVQIWVGDGAKSKIFVEGGNSGAAQTGQWIRPGTIFSMRLPGTNGVIDLAALPSKQCGKAAKGHLE